MRLLALLYGRYTCKHVATWRWGHLEVLERRLLQTVKLAGSRDGRSVYDGHEDAEGTVYRQPTPTRNDFHWHINTKETGKIII